MENMRRNQEDGSNQHPSHSPTPRRSSRNKPRRSKSEHEKRNITKNNDSEKVLPELTIDLFELIVKRLDVVGFCTFGAVCKSWLEICDRIKEDFLESQAPIAVLTSPHAERTCYLFDMAKGKTKEVTLPNNLVGKFYVGCSGGYLIIENINRQISLVNPLTRHRLKCQAPPFTSRGRTFHDHIIFASTLSRKSYVVVAICNNKREFQVFHSSNGQWSSGYFYGASWVDIAVFNDQVYVVTKEAQLAKLKVRTTGSSTLIEMRNTPNVNSEDLKFVVSDNQLLMVDFVPEKHLNIYKIDFDAMEWVKLDKLGEQSLFLGGKWGSAIRKPDRWGGQTNCVYHLQTQSAMCNIYSMEAKLISNFPLVENSTTSEWLAHGWYHPHQCIKVDNLTED
ncbi:Galactose oxidase/kelch, beta-propeller [Sesbania bispinosa]|nr:Galactose oxidase/kelch, beta-propeller [Sesbania bispinosa]